jgi:hypothetical protein
VWAPFSPNPNVDRPICNLPGVRLILRSEPGSLRGRIADRIIDTKRTIRLVRRPDCASSRAPLRIGTRSIKPRHHEHRSQRRERSFLLPGSVPGMDLLLRSRFFHGTASRSRSKEVQHNCLVHRSRRRRTLRKSETVLVWGKKMFKVFGFLTKKDGLGTQEFIDYYESKHVPLVCSLAPVPTVYKRRYLVDAAFPSKKLRNRLRPRYHNTRFA